MRNEMLWLNIKSILASKENQVSKPLITEHHPVFSKVRIKGACLEIYGVVTGLILVGLSSNQKRYHIKSRWGQTTPQMGHEMSRFLVNF